MKKWYAIMAFIVIALFGSVISFNIFKAHMIAKFMSSMPEPVYPVTTMTVKPQTWHPVIEAIGFIQPYAGVDLSSEQGGKIAKINFASGQKVSKGDLLIELDTQVEKANLISSEADLPAIKAKMNRMLQLYKSNNVSRQALDAAKASYYNLIGQIDSLKALIQRRLITAPFDGIVGIRNIYEGQYLQPGSPVVRLENNDIMRIQFTITQKDLAKVTPGLPVHIMADAYPNRNFIGEINALEPVVNSDSGVIDVQASIPNSNGQLRSGMFAQVKILIPEMKNQIVIPLHAINFQLYGQSVYVVKPVTDNKQKILHYTAKQISIHIKEYREGLALVSSGLKAGDQIVTLGQVRLSNGSHVKITQQNKLIAPEKIPYL
ncbi:MAG: efflux RND transporter periplasmic adaptor subunit [Endozoicomonadaceae bacterium]|nr:efflux RND transporter periplasmic adaptor subunit [Endozoicomonadaceae bacterium]